MGWSPLNSTPPGATGQETGIEIDNALNTPGADPVITVNYSITQPAWLASGSLATYSYATHILTVTGATTIIGDPGSDQPIIQANGSAGRCYDQPHQRTSDSHRGSQLDQRCIDKPDLSGRGPYRNQPPCAGSGKPRRNHRADAHNRLHQPFESQRQRPGRP